MTRIKVFVEGQTEETFVRDVLAPYFFPLNIYLTAIIVNTSKGYRGGVVNYEKVKHQVVRLCDEDKGAFVTTMIDYYGLPTNFPGYHLQLQASAKQRISMLESAFSNDVSRNNFIPNLMLHEFEAYLFCDPSQFDIWSDNAAPSFELAQIRQAFDSPEDINDSPHTAPSKRIIACVPGYRKTLHGPIIASEIGIDIIRGQCPHFDQWIRSLSALAPN